MTNGDKFLKWTLCVLALLALGSGMSSILAAQESKAATSPQTTMRGGLEFEGIVKVGLGKYFYLPSAKGFDIVVQGKIEGQDASFLTDKEVRIKGELFEEEPSVLIADTIEVKEGAQYRTVFTRTENVSIEDHLDLKQRAEFVPLTIKAYNRSEDWEGKGKAKIFGRLERKETPGGDEIYTIVVLDEKGKEVGKILVDTATDFARYYIKKLRLFSSFWFYLQIKDTVDLKTRRQTRELFHADLLFAGLY
ncbi:MAG: hypothetical protein ACUVV5_04070 [Candidatus Aminicenantales bacterium]